MRHGGGPSARPCPALAVFPTASPLLWVAPVPTCGLFAWHAELLGELGAVVAEHWRDGAWVPHGTIAESAAPGNLATVLALWRGPVPVRLERIELVRFPPPAVVAGHVLAG